MVGKNTDNDTAVFLNTDIDTDTDFKKYPIPIPT